MDKTSLSFFLPFYNEEEIIREIVKKTENCLKELERDYEIIIVDDGSEDHTHEIAEKLSTSPKIKTVRHEKNQGYGNALKSGFKHSSNPLVAYMDGDGQFNPREISRFLEEINESDIVVGKRSDRKDNFSRKIIAKVFNKLNRKIFDTDLKDIDCGFKLVRKETIKDITLKTDRTVDAELLIKAENSGYSIKQLEVTHLKREKGESEAEALIGVRPKLILKTFKELFEIKWDVR